MVLALRTDSFVASAVTHQTLFNGIKQAFLDSGFTASFDDYVSGTDKIVVYAIVTDSTKTNGTSYLRIRVTTGLAIFQQLFAGWTVATHVGTNGSTEIAYTAIIPTTQVNFTALKANPELSLVMINQGTNVIALGFLSPANRPGWWDLNAWSYCFIPTTNTFAAFRSTVLNPFTNPENDSSLNFIRLGNPNNQTNRRDLLPGVILYTQTSQGITGRSSDDLVSVSATGSTRYDTLQIPGDTKQYLIINPAAGGLAVRIT